MLDAPVPFSCRAIQVHEAQWVVAFGELDLLNAPALEAALSRAISHGAPVVLDPRGLTFCDSSGRRVLETIDRVAAETGQRFSVLRGSFVLDRLVALVPDAPWPEFVVPPQGSPRPQPPTARSLDPTGTPATRLKRDSRVREVERVSVVRGLELDSVAAAVSWCFFDARSAAA